MKKIFIILISLLIVSNVVAADKIEPRKTPLIKLSKQLGTIDPNNLSFKSGGELVKIQSYSAFTYKAIKEGWYKEKPIEVEALLTFPKGEGPFPVLLLVHSSGGAVEFTADYLEFMRDQQKPLLDMGIATMYLDNFSGRGVTQTYKDQSQVSIWSTYIDAFMALEYLSKNLKVNKKKIGISGFSRGGNISMMAGEKRIRDALISKDLYFAAAQPRSPECGMTSMFRNPQPIKETKMWLVHGMADDLTSRFPCEELVKKMNANGGNVKIDLKVNWRHMFTGNFDVKFVKNLQNFSKCPPWYTEDDGSISKEMLDILLKHRAFKSEEEFDKISRENPRKAFKKTIKGLKREKCIGKGAHIGGDHGKIFMRKYLKFWKENLIN